MDYIKKKIVKEFINIILSVNLNIKPFMKIIYETYFYGFIIRKPYKYFIKLKRYIIEFIYFDLIKLLLIISIKGERYFIYTFYNKIKFKDVKPLRKKNNIFKYFLIFKIKYE